MVTKLYNYLGTAEEVVSIYGPNFTTPESRAPYYIKIRRCVIDEYAFSINTACWSVPKNNSRKEIEIVVPDINNNKKFYKYVVYNDTACECGKGNNAMRVPQHKLKDLKTHESIT